MAKSIAGDLNTPYHSGVSWLRALPTPVTLICAGLLSACANKLPATSCEPLGDFPGPEDFDLVELEGKRVMPARDAMASPLLTPGARFATA